MGCVSHGPRLHIAVALICACLTGPAVGAEGPLEAVAWCSRVLASDAAEPMTASIHIPRAPASLIARPPDVTLSIAVEEGSGGQGRVEFATALLHFAPSGRLIDVVLAGIGRNNARIRGFTGRRALPDQASCEVVARRDLEAEGASFLDGNDSAVRRILLKRLTVPSAKGELRPEVVEIAFDLTCYSTSSGWEYSPRWKAVVSFSGTRPYWLAERYGVAIEPFEGFVTRLAAHGPH